MSTAIVLPQLPEWFEGRLKALYTAKTVQEFDEAFELFVSKHATIRVNGHDIDRDQYKQMIQGEIKTEVDADVTFQGIVTVPPKGSNDSYTGSVGAFFKAVVYGRIFIFAQRESSTVSSSINVVVKEDVARPHTIGRGGAFDGRRVTVLDEVLTDVANQIRPPVSVPPLEPTSTASA
ncbi:hypothetical protein C8Q70DRAFT_936131 [Cubamyces menziesii]|nr:hypothetical protein C8Q70DRAFT_936131 [Cubamyces menziesii]